MDSTSIWIIVLVAFALIAGYYVARSAARREAVHGGALGHAANYAASALLIAIAPTVLCSVLVIHPTFIANSTILSAVFIAVVMIVLALLFLLPYAALAKPTLDKLTQQEDTGWTEEDARTSGL